MGISTDGALAPRKQLLVFELIARFDKPALVLVPTGVTIREQWVDRIFRQAF